ncbi:MAG: ATP-binding protein [Candidatus Aenigmatarchaeota archaeon]
MYVKRDIEEYFDKVSSIYDIIAIVGARQAGKTTLLRKKLGENNGKYISLDDPDARELFNEDIKKFEKQYVDGEGITGIDEVQYGSDAGMKLKYLADKGNKLWVTSSSEIILGKDVLSYLVGRVSIIKLFPFSLKEFQRASGIKSLTKKIKERIVWEHINYGGYPKVILTDDSEMKKVILRDLIETMILKDVSRTFSIDDIDSLEKLVRYLAINTGALVSYEGITSSLGISFQTLRKYLKAMEKSYIITVVSPFYTNKSKELIKKPKIYFVDTGLRNAIVKRSFKEFQGTIFENYVLTELMKSGFSLKYWRTKGKTEVDFIIEMDDSIVPIEVKTSANKIGKNLKSFIKTYKPERAFIVSYKGKGGQMEFEGCKISFVDIFELLGELSS